MSHLWRDLAPLILISAALPLQTIVTLVLVRSSPRAAVAWVAGMTTVRVAQGLLFGLVLIGREAPGSDSPRWVFGALTLLLSLLLFVKALRAALGVDEEDAPPPKWLTLAKSMSPMTAFATGAGFMAVSIKFLVFTLAAIGAIGEARLGLPRAIGLYLLFVVLVQAMPIVLLVLGASSDPRSAAMLDRFGAWLQRHNRSITILLGVVFGIWFLTKALTHLGLT